MAKNIAGSGGGRQQASAPAPQPVIQQTVVVQQVAPTASDDANSLFSKSSVRIVDLISEGEIEGFATATTKESVYLNDTPIQSGGTDNFVYDSFETRVGTSGQSYISGFPSAENAISVNAEIGDDVADFVTRQITDTTIDAVVVRLSFPQLFVVSNGLKATSVGYAIDVQANGGGYVEKVNTTLNGKCTSPYERSHRIELTGSPPWDIKVRRVSGINDGTTNYRRLVFAGYTETVDSKLRYPLSALVGLRFEATQFQSIPTRSYDIKGVKVQIPSNATVNDDGSLSYSGVWNGNFQIAWCADPCWIMRDLILSERYGLGRFVSSSQIDKWTLYEISKYCNEKVNDGQGGQEPRFLCNVYLQDRAEAYNVVQDFASCFRGMAYWAAGSIAFSQDRPSDAVALFNNSNVIEGLFNYEGSSLKTRHTVALVTWNDPENAYQQKVEYVSDEAAIAKYGYIEIRTVAFGCTSRGQANRVGRWLLYQEQNETETVTFTVGLDGAVVRPGQIIKVMDQMRVGDRKAGRVASATTSVITLDQGISAAAGDFITIVHTDGRVERARINSSDTSAKTITLTTALSVAPAAQSVYMVESSTVEAQEFRVISVTEDNEQYKISALEHNSSKYDYVEDGLKLEERQITLLNSVPDSPTGISVSERLVEAGNKVTTEVTVSWKSVNIATAYQVSYKTTNNDSYTTIGDTPYNAITFNTDETGTFTFRVVAISAIGKRSSAATASKSIAGKTSVPGDVQNLSFEAISNNSGRLSWDPTVDLDVKVGGKVYIRHSSLTDGSATWSNSVDLIEAKSGSATQAIIPLVEGEVLVKFADDGGRLSTNETSIIIDLPDAVGSLTIITRREDQDSPPFQGTDNNTFYSDEYDALTLDGSSSFDDITDVDDIPVFDFLGDVQASGTYTFATTVDLGNTFSLDLKRYFVTRGFFPSDLVDTRAENVDDWDDWDGGVIDKVNATLNLRTTTDDPSGSPTWSNWKTFVNGTYKARGFQFRADLSSSDVAENILVDQLGYDATFQRRTEQSVGSIASGAGAKAVTFTNAFFTGTASIGGTNAYLPSVGVTGQNMQSGDYFEVTSVSGTGFTVTFKNSGGTAVDRNFTYTAVGFGKAG
jgi:predicted phage tail protein